MAKYHFRLLEGQHIQADPTRPIVGPDGKPTGRFERRVYQKGDVIETDTDLAAKLGANKFEPLTGDGGQARIAELERELAEARAAQGAGSLPGDPNAQNLALSPAVAPGGQVSTGFQHAAGSSRGTASGPLDPAKAERAGAAGFGLPAEAAKAAGKQQQDFTAAASDTPPDAPPDAPTDADLEGMTVQELRDYAQEEEINLHGASTKAEIVKAIRKGK
jgi:hypothetical protein